MGASASVSVKGVAGASDSGFGWWKTAGAAAATYTFNGTALADAAPAVGSPMTVGPSPKFAAGPKPITFVPVNLAVTGPLGSIANSSVVGSSNAGVVLYGANIYATASTSAAAAAGAAAAATADGTDPWDVTIPHRPGRKSFVLVVVEPDFSLTPERGESGLRLHGTFGVVSLSLRSSDNKPKAHVQLEPGWHVYEQVRLPTLGDHMRAPHQLLSSHDLEALFLRQHGVHAPVWLWQDPVPTLAFVKEVPASQTAMTVEVGIEVSDASSGDEEEQRS